MKLVEHNYNCDRLERGDRFFIGNGAYGYRGTLEENTKQQCVALNAACFYDRCGDNWRETVNMPNPLYLTIEVNGQVLGADNAVAHEEILDISCGQYLRKTTFKVGEITVSVDSVRFFDQTRNDFLISRLNVACSANCALILHSGIDCDVWNISGDHFVVDSTQTNPLAVFCTTNEGKKLSVGVTEKASAMPVKTQFDDGKLCNVYSVYGTSFCVAKYCILSHTGLLGGSVETDFDAIQLRNKQWWDNKWNTSRVILGNDDIQTAIDYCVYQLLCYAPKVDGMSIGARGLSGQTYKGAIFWDTEMFMLPFYIATDTSAAKRLVRYRINTLQGALDKARHYGYRGAFFAWESQDGTDACSDFNVTDVFTGRPVRTYFKDKQIHISADIAVALYNTYFATQDISLLTDGGAQLVAECSLFYLSYAYFNPSKNRYELLDTIGPDEYHERVNNNAYTNYMAHECVDIFFRIVSLLKKHAPACYNQLMTQYACDIAPLRKFRKLLYLPQPDANGVIEQFDGYFGLEDVSVQTVRQRLVHPNEYWGGSNGVATPTKVIKQADVVALMCVLPHRFDTSVKAANYNYYLPYTEHGSSLSASMYSQCACLIGKPDDAYPWFEKSAKTDLVGGGKKYAGGVYIGGAHPAACGGAWLTVYNGFLSDRNGASLPKQLDKVVLCTQKGRIERSKQ